MLVTKLNHRDRFRRRLLALHDGELNASIQRPIGRRIIGHEGLGISMSLNQKTPLIKPILLGQPMHNGDGAGRRKIPVGAESRGADRNIVGMPGNHNPAFDLGQRLLELGQNRHEGRRKLSESRRKRALFPNSDHNRRALGLDLNHAVADLLTQSLAEFFCVGLRLGGSLGVAVGLVHRISFID